MFKKNDYVFHNREGMQFIEDIITVDFNGVSKTFYVLKPVYSSSSSSLQLPVELEYTLRYPMDKKHANKLLKDLKNVTNIWVVDNKQRKELFNDLFTNGSTKDLANIIYTISLKKKEYTAVKKSLPLSDFKTLELAKKLISEEFAYALNQDYKEIEKIIIDNIG